MRYILSILLFLHRCSGLGHRIAFGGFFSTGILRDAVSGFTHNIHGRRCFPLGGNHSSIEQGLKPGIGSHRVKVGIYGRIRYRRGTEADGQLQEIAGILI